MQIFVLYTEKSVEIHILLCYLNHLEIKVKLIITDLGEPVNVPVNLNLNLNPGMNTHLRQRMSSSSRLP